jgi:hypothetical protein
MTRQTVIYAWLCPSTGRPVYVGKTSQPLDGRMRSHLREARKGAVTPKHRWLGKTVGCGLMPRVVALDICSPAASPATERRWVRRLSRFDLLNVATAGAGNPGVGRVEWTPEIDRHLGKVPDSELAAMLGCERKTVSYRRRCLGIPASFDRKNNKPPPNNAGWNRKELSPDIIALLGFMSDHSLAEKAGVSKTRIMRERQSKGIPSHAAVTGNDGRIKVGEPHRRWTRTEGDTPPARPPM